MVFFISKFFTVISDGGYSRMMENRRERDKELIFLEKLKKNREMAERRRQHIEKEKRANEEKEAAKAKECNVDEESLEPMIDEESLEPMIDEESLEPIVIDNIEQLIPILEKMNRVLNALFNTPPELPPAYYRFLEYIYSSINGGGPLDIVVFLQFSGSIFLVGLWGILAVRNNLITTIISLELLLFACTLNFIFFASLHDDILCQVFAFLILTVAAAESSLGLALLILYYRLRRVVSVEFVTLLKGLVTY
jgi:NADH:ubiquinone oxidoreductase subunit K